MEHICRTNIKFKMTTFRINGGGYLINLYYIFLKKLAQRSKFVVAY